MDNTPQGLELRDLRIFKGTTALLHLNTIIPPGEILTVKGASGSGKSTLLAAIAGTLDTSVFRCTGAIRLNGQDILALPAHQRGIGVLFQDPLLFPHLSVAQNLLFGLKDRTGRAARHQAVQDALASLDLHDAGPRDPATLSGGQQARVALLRTLLSDPQALLLDEPFSKLDTALRTKTRDIVFDTSRQKALPVVLVTHDDEDAAHAGGPVIEIGSKTYN